MKEKCDEKCDKCGEITNLCYVFEYDSYVAGFRLKFCRKCGEKILERLRNEG